MDRYLVSLTVLYPAADHERVTAAMATEPGWLVNVAGFRAFRNCPHLCVITVCELAAANQYDAIRTASLQLSEHIGGITRHHVSTHQATPVQGINRGYSPMQWAH